MSIELPPINAAGYEPRQGKEYPYFKPEEINATLIDPATGARLNEVATDVGVDMRRTTDGQAAFLSTLGTARESDFGIEAFALMLQ